MNDQAVLRRSVMCQAAAMLLCYPDGTLHQRLPLIENALAEQESAPAQALRSFCDHVRRTTELDLGADYVRTFDLKRRRALHLTYYTDGDTRRRGHALARIKEIYAACGWRLDPGELPDHLAVVLEFTARGDAAQGMRLLAAFQPGIELLRAALHDCRSAYAPVLDAVAATLPPSDEARREATRMAAAGPPAEDVGLDPYGSRSAVPLGMPVAMGAER
ncbi:MULTISPECIES: nitrate reductase molybdenum cofactor assembly chaperone [Glycomyces]|uniref:Nitrate reductase delta subunit n=2 Tax=Glycomyces TaxID=58113 RepID=A0A9X3PNQ9_9ACTN|nr:nitrate reductase molybdenum cofactor assembly chaperone [Glycomyces lechevalierae]MDA1387206.1 nitrate reductase molybdenum cofactor assembly chaperone [Glycomyces lechevalierae]MDR7338530.1 nitrate reductase delta subunit [Glycomyces lechevalierae]